MSQQWPAEVQNRLRLSTVKRRASGCAKRMRGCGVFWLFTVFLFRSPRQTIRFRFKLPNPRQWRARRTALANESRSSGACFVGERMSMRAGGIIPTAGLDTHRQP